MLIALTLTLVACNSLPRSASDMADEQVSSGTVTMPTASNPVVYGTDGMMYLYTGYVDGGVYNVSEFNMCGDAQGFAMQWDPKLCDQAFGTYTASTGEVALVTQFPYPSAFRGTPATPDAVTVDWEAGNGDNLGEQGLNDGWYNTPDENGIPNVFQYTDCGWSHPNIYGGWDRNGDIALPIDPSELGEDFCDRQDTGN